MLCSATLLLLRARPPPVLDPRARWTGCTSPPTLRPAPPLFSALIIDNRASAALDFAVRHMACTLPADWPLVLIGSAEVTAFALSHFKALLRSGRMELWELASTPAPRTLVPICGACGVGGSAFRGAALELGARRPWSRDYNLGNDLLLNEAVLGAVVPSPQFIVFQTDGMLCRALRAHELAELHMYDYVGAPWAHETAPVDLPRGGNGGFSFRTLAVMRRILTTLRTSWWAHALALWGVDIMDTIGNEDVALSSRVVAAGGRLPPLRVCANFSVETLGGHGGDDVAGYHKPWQFLDAASLLALSTRCPVIAEAAAHRLGDDVLSCASDADARRGSK